MSLKYTVEFPWTDSQTRIKSGLHPSLRSKDQEGKDGRVHTLPAWRECFRLSLELHFDCTWLKSSFLFKIWIYGEIQRKYGPFTWWMGINACQQYWEDTNEECIEKCLMWIHDTIFFFPLTTKLVLIEISKEVYQCIHCMCCVYVCALIGESGR